MLRFSTRFRVKKAMLSSLMFSLWAVAGAAAVPLDRVLVVVNDDVITATEVGARIPAVRRQLARQNVRIPSEDVLRKSILDRMVLERLQLQVAKQLGIEVENDKIEFAIQRIAQDNRMSRDEFIAALKQEGLGEDEFRQQIRAQLTIQQLVDREVNNRVTISNSELENFLSRNPGGDVEYNLSHILVAVPESASSEAIQTARKRADELWNELKRGGDFEQLAIAHSQDDKALEAGSLGWKKAGQLPALFVQAVEKLALGGVSEVLRSANGFHIVKLNDKRGGGQPHAVTQSHARHILIRPNELLGVDEAKAKLLALRHRIENGEDFAALAKANSDDAGSANNGGDLGWMTPGQSVREFERAVQALAPQQLSEPIRTPFGWHLIQLLERREQDISEERRVANARQQLHARKADERYEQWLRQLRDEAYVDYKAR